MLDIVNDDMPFLVDSVVGELNERGLDIRLLVHPVFIVERDAAGKLAQLQRRAHGRRRSAKASSTFISTGADDAAQRAEIVRALESILADVRVCVQDWQPMLARARDIIADLRANPPPLPVEEIAEAIQFLEWMADDNFTLLGARDYAFTDNEDALEPTFETGLGLLRSRDMRLLRRWNEPLTITPEIRAFLEQPSSSSSPRRRCARACIGASISIISASSASTATASSSANAGSAGCSPRPPIRARRAPFPICGARLDSIIRRAGFDPSSHSGKALVNVLETYPRDELFQIDEDTLYQFALAILQLDERPRVRVLPRRDRFDRFVSVLVYVPRDRYDSRIRAAIGDYLAAAFKGRVSAFYPFFPERPLVRVHFIIGRIEGETPNPDRAVARPRGRGDRAQLDRRSREALAAGPDPARGPRAVRALSRRLSDRLSRSLSAGDGGRRYSASSRR